MLGVRVDPASVGDIHAFVEKTVANGEQAQILNVNVNCLNLAVHRPWLHQMLNDAPVVFCDGTGVQWAARLLGGPVPPRVPYNTWMWELAAFAADRDYAFYFLGAKPGVAQRAADRLRLLNPDLRVVGIHDGYFDRAPQSCDTQAILADINASGAHILLLGLGMPMQEEWLLRSWPCLRVNIALTGGAAMDYLAGDLTTPPAWVAIYGFEWLQRLAMEPRRLWRRYLIGNPIFFARVIGQWLGGPGTYHGTCAAGTTPPVVHDQAHPLPAHLAGRSNRSGALRRGSGRPWPAGTGDRPGRTSGPAGR